MLPVGLQLYSLREQAATDLEGTLKKIHEMGYAGIEFAGLYGHSPEEVKELLAKYDLKPVSAHISINEFLGDIPGTVAAYKAIGCLYAAIPWLDEPRRPGHEKWDETLEQIRQIAEECRKQGLTLMYHNHDFEFEKLDGEYALDRLYATIPADLLQTEFDTCWVHFAGEDPVKYLHKYAGRCPIVHLKDYYATGEKADPAYDLIGQAPNAKRDRSNFEFRTLGQGLVPVDAVAKASVEAGAKWLIVELDSAPSGMTSEESVRESRRYLASLGY